MSLDNRRAVPGSPRAQRTFIHACEAAQRRAPAPAMPRRAPNATRSRFTTPLRPRRETPASGSYAGSVLTLDGR